MFSNRLHRAISNLTHSMFQRQDGFTTKQHLCWHIPCRSTFSGVECELTHWQQNVPIHLPGSDKTPRNLFNWLVHSFALTLRLRMVGRTHSQFTLKRTYQRQPKPTKEPAIAIGYDPLRHTVPWHHCCNEQLHELFSRNSTLTRDKIDVLRHTIHKCCNCITTSLGDRQVSNDVRHAFLKHVIWWRQQL